MLGLLRETADLVENAASLLHSVSLQRMSSFRLFAEDKEMRAAVELQHMKVRSGLARGRRQR